MRLFLAGIFAFLMFSCNEKTTHTSLNTGAWRGVLEVQDGRELPFNFKVHEDSTLTIFNADEEILVDEIEYWDDSLRIKLPVFEGYILGTYQENTIDASFIKESLDRVVPFKARYTNDQRFKIVDTSTSINVSGNWETVFSPGITEDEYIAKGIFQQEGNKVTGTFRTTTGDYRYLEGVQTKDSLKLSTFDGAHAFLFLASISDSTMQGVFYSGNHFQEPFTARLNNDYELPDPDSLTFLNEGYEKLAFSFPDETGDIISLDDDRFKEKVVIVQILGSWCPNCLDETKFFVDYYNKNKTKDIEFIGLAFEYAKTEEKAFRSIKRLKDKIDVPYPILLAQYGFSGKESKTMAQKKLPMLNHVLSYPTSIYVDKKGVVRKIHTGFNGPATGDQYTEFVQDFDSYINKLLSE